MNQVNKHKLPAIKAIKYENQLCLTINSLQHTLYFTFNTTFYQQIDIDVLDKIVDKSSSSQAPFSKEEFRNAITNCSNSSTLGPDKLSWNHFKIIIKDDKCLSNIISIANTYIDLGYQPAYFKRSIMIVIPKPNKQLYDFSKLFRPIVLLNTVGKLIKKVIGERL